jgi:hypothetical protein
LICKTKQNIIKVKTEANEQNIIKTLSVKPNGIKIKEVVLPFESS